MSNNQIVAAFETWGSNNISSLYLASVDSQNRVDKFVEDSESSFATLHVFCDETDAIKVYNSYTEEKEEQ